MRANRFNFKQIITRNTQKINKVFREIHVLARFCPKTALVNAAPSNFSTKMTIFFEKALTKEKRGGIILNVVNLGVAQLVARYLGVVEAASSSLVTQTISSVHN